MLSSASVAFVSGRPLYSRSYLKQVYGVVNGEVEGIQNVPRIRACLVSWCFVSSVVSVLAAYMVSCSWRLWRLRLIYY